MRQGIHFFRTRKWMVFAIVLVQVFLSMSFWAFKGKSVAKDLPIPTGVLSYIEERKKSKDIDEIINNFNLMKQNGKWDESLQMLETGIQKFPDSDKLHTYKGGWYFDKG